MNDDLFLEPHQRRVVDEANELAVRIVRLREFMEGTSFAHLGADEQDRLTRQFRFMHGYSGVLTERIAAF